MFGIIGYVITSVIAAIIIAYKITGDVYPRGLKRCLNKLLIKNWQNSLKKQLNLYNVSNIKSTNDAAIVPSQSEIELEKTRDIKNISEIDQILLYGIDPDGNESKGLVVKISRFYGDFTQATICLLHNGRTYGKCFKGKSSSSFEFTLGNLRVEMVEPFRVWRIWMNEALRHEDGDMVHVVINSLWKPLENPEDQRKESNIDLLAEYLTDKGTFGSNASLLENLLPSGHSQFGSLHGTLKLDGENKGEFYFYGYKRRDFISLNNCKTSKFEVFGMTESDANGFYLRGVDDDWIDGKALCPDRSQSHVVNVDGNARNFNQEGISNFPKSFNLNCKKFVWQIETWPKGKHVIFSESALEILFYDLKIKGVKGKGIVLRNLTNFEISEIEVASNIRNFNTVQSSIENDQNLDLIPFNSEFCLSVPLVGGKGASLSRLANIDKKSFDFKTANGFCVSTALFKKLLDLNEFEILFKKFPVNEAVQIIKKEIISADLQEKLTRIVNEWMKKDEKNSKRLFAVRSSGVLEDASDLSSAGQNETFLGVDMKNVPNKILHCWASLFSEQSVQYRLNHGQKAISEMGVVVQEMVYARKAGVIFTADPMTGDPFKLTINANYGLGESVVSATCDPDTFIVSLNRGKCIPNELFTISSKSLGGKAQKVIMVEETNADEKAQMVKTTNSEANEFCLSDQEALMLGDLAFYIQKMSHDFKPIDVEWAINEAGDFYILQSRHITSLDAWTDFEIIHELDTGIRCQNDRFTLANTGEVMPGAASTLGITMSKRNLEVTMQARLNEINTYPIHPVAGLAITIARNRLMLDVFYTMYHHVKEKIDPTNVCLDLSIFGHQVIDEEINNIALQRYGVNTPLQNIGLLADAFKGIMTSKRKINQADEMFRNYKFNYDVNSEKSDELYKTITDELFQLTKISGFHLRMSEISGMLQTFAFLTLAGGKEIEDWDSDMYEDLSVVLSVCSKVESADIPLSIATLGDAIIEFSTKNQIDLTHFVEGEPKEALNFLQKHEELNEELKKFMNKHGHRSTIAEMDLMKHSWRDDQVKFTTLLQPIVRNTLNFDKEKFAPIVKKTFDSDTQLLDSLKTLQNSSSKSRFLKFLLPYCRNGVMNRERSKSLLVRTVNEFKKPYRLLGRLLVKENLLTDERHIFYLKHYEIGQLIRREITTPRILFKVLKRSRIIPQLEKETFPEISIGIPKPLEEDEDEIDYGECLKATPVSGGKVTGIVRVCMSVQEAASTLLPGDILITHATDIGWSPFFPFLGGIVTELGGLISHGAVVAREFGLPCIVGATHATKMFTSGEEVILDAGKGTLTKVNKGENKPIFV